MCSLEAKMVGLPLLPVVWGCWRNLDAKDMRNSCWRRWLRKTVALYRP